MKLEKLEKLIDKVFDYGLPKAKQTIIQKEDKNKKEVTTSGWEKASSSPTQE